MYRDRRIALVIPAFNEERLIKPTLENVPEEIDTIYVVDDASVDGTREVVLKKGISDSRIVLLTHEKNSGPGQAIITGYLQASKDNHDITVVVGGDFQMPLEEISRFLDPIIEDTADYVKGNRFIHFSETREHMPKLRIIGNIIITAMTKISSGYYKIMDVVDGYTAISKTAIDTINWEKAWKGYGYPMDFLCRLNAYGFRVKDVHRIPIYLPNERQTQIKGLSYALRVMPMLIRNFFWRLFYRYLYRDFHPLVFFFIVGLILFPIGLALGFFLLYSQIIGEGVSGPKATLSALLILLGLQFLLFAMLFDMQEGDR